MSKYHTISHDAASELIWSQRVNGQGRIFAIAFDRTGDGSSPVGTREVLYVRFNVRRHLAHGADGWIHRDGAVRPWWGAGARPRGSAYDRAQHGCFCVYCVNRRGPGDRGYKSIRFESLRWLKLDGVVYRVGAPPPKQH